MHKKTPVLEALFDKVAGLLEIKKKLTQLFSCEYYKMFKNTYFEENLRKAASTLNNIFLEAAAAEVVVLVPKTFSEPCQTSRWSVLQNIRVEGTRAQLGIFQGRGVLIE